MLSARILFLLAILNIPLYAPFGVLLFGNRRRFTEAVSFTSREHFACWFRGGHWHTFFPDMLRGVYVGLCGALLYGEMVLLQAWFGLS